MEDMAVNNVSFAWLGLYVVGATIWLVAVLGALLNNHTHTTPEAPEQSPIKPLGSGYTKCQHPSTSQVVDRLFALTNIQITCNKNQRKDINCIL